MSAVFIRPAAPGDLPAIVRLHEADALGGHGDLWSEAVRPSYEAAFDRIATSPDNALFVAVEAGEVVGTFQLTLIPVLTGRGTLRAKLESVQVRADRRSRGIGAVLMAFAEAEARRLGAASLELTSGKRRADAHRFYERLGFARSHEGFRKPL